MTFLEKLADEILRNRKDSLQNLCFVFPSKRAGIFFKKSLSEKLDKPAWAPEIYSIEDFVERLSSYIIPDRLILIFELFEVYKSHGEDESFDKFYPWGEMMLRDFDEIDKNLIAGSEIFKIIRELKEVETAFSFTPDDLEQFSRFWRTFSYKELTNLQNEFIKTWEILGKVYSNYRKRLAEKNYAYEGMAYRKLYEEIKTAGIKIPWNKIIFAGFNLLTKSESGIIKELLKQDKAETYWDTDEYYINDPRQEARKFLRNNFRDFNLNSPKWIDNKLSSAAKSVKVTGAPLKAGEAKAFGDVLRQELVSGKIDPEKTAVVLPDESLLIPVLNSLPGEIDSLNVTMGFPMRETPLYNLVELLKSLQSRKKPGDGSAVFYHKDVIRILLHPYIKFINPAYIYDTVNDIIRNNIIYVSGRRLFSEEEKHPEILDLIFRDLRTAAETSNCLFKILDFISGRMEKSGSAFAKFELEFFYVLYENLNRIKDTADFYSAEMNTDTFWRIVTEVLRAVRVPLTGEPLKGMQIMGLLETRALDFENVYILSMNEGIMPKGAVQNSFIPYNIRKAFKLPTYEDEDAVPAYYFYRLLQRAKNIRLFYNTEVDLLSMGETSRFILQIENELIKVNKNIDYLHTSASIEIPRPFRQAITINKTPEMLAKLKDTAFSPSDLSNYINCTLKFYLRKLAKLDEEDTVEEFFSPATFGSILHNVVEIIYNNYKGIILTKEIIDEIRENLNSNYDAILKEAFEKTIFLKELDPRLQGKNHLLKNIIKKLVNKILDSDIKNLPFKLVDLEMKIEEKIEIKANGNPQDIRLRGRIDRIDEKENLQVIIDYKTGIFKESRIPSKTTEDYFENIFTEPKLKEYFQAYFYAYTYLRKDGNLPVKIAIYPLKTVSKGLTYLNEGTISDEQINMFESKLIGLLEEIFDSGTPFAQIEDKQRCMFCPFISICYRE
jgi:CRISPR/Cas system-associated exonuclease Cas4 (RecB family)